MKKIRLIVIGIIILLISIALIIIFTNDNIKFKVEYEMYNTQLFESKKNKVNVKIPINNGIKYLNNKELDEFLENGTGIIYFGYSTCPWCRNILPILIDASKESNINKIYYVNTHSKIDEDKLIDKLKDFLSIDDEGNKRFAVPDVYVIKDGKIINNHRGTVDSYHNPYKGMNDKQKQELKDIYLEMFRVIK